MNCDAAKEMQERFEHSDTVEPAWAKKMNKVYLGLHVLDGHGLGKFDVIPEHDVVYVMDAKKKLTKMEEKHFYSLLSFGWRYDVDDDNFYINL